MANKKIEPLFGINPNFRLQFPYFSILSVLINDDAKQQNDLRDIVLSKYIDLYEFLMK